MEKYLLVICVVCLMFFVAIGRFVVSPLKRILKIICNSVIGFIIMYVINLVGTNYNFHIGLNWWTLTCSGVLGIPGILLMLLMKFFG